MVDLKEGAGIGLSATLYVVRISSGSHAEQQGVKLGARVVAISGEIVQTLDDFKRLVAKCRERGDAECVVEYEPYEHAQNNESKNNSDAAAAEEEEEEDNEKYHSTETQKNDPSMQSALESRRLWQEARREVMKSRKSII